MGKNKWDDGIFDPFGSSPVENMISPKEIEVKKEKEEQTAEKQEKEKIKTVDSKVKENKPQVVKEKQPVGRPKSAVEKRRITFDMDKALVDDVNKIILVKYPREDKMSLTRLLEAQMKTFVASNKSLLAKYNELFN